MLYDAATLSHNIASLPSVHDQIEGITAFVNVIANFTNQVQAGSGGTAGILTFGNAAMISLLLAMPPVKDDSWIPLFANAWQAGILSSIITAGTVTNVAWTGSGGKDVLTLSSAVSTIPTISAAKAILIAGLGSITPSSDAPLPFAVAIRNATLGLSFQVIGLGPPPTLIPTPLIFTAQ